MLPDSPIPTARKPRRRRLRLARDWKLVLRKAWSIRLLLVAGVLTGIEAILPMLSSRFPAKPFAIATFIVVAAAFGSRLMAQKSMDDDD